MKLPGIRSILFTILFGLLLLPALQKKFDIFSFRPLTGEYIPATKESFTTAGWFDGGFQKSYEKFFEEHIGFRNPLIRL